MKTKEVTLTADEYTMYQLYLQGIGRIQDMLPNVPPPERELLRLMGGVCSECWNLYLGQPEEEDVIPE